MDVAGGASAELGAGNAAGAGVGAGAGAGAGGGVGNSTRQQYQNPAPPSRPEHLESEAQHLLYLAKVADQCKRYTAMLEYMKRVVGLGVPLTATERNMLATAYERNIAPLRAAYRLSKDTAEDHKQQSYEGHERVKDMHDEKEIVHNHYNKYFVKPPLLQVLDDLLKVVRGVALPYEEQAAMKQARKLGASRTFRPTTDNAIMYKKLIADALRYKAEMAEEKHELEAAAEAAEGMYGDAWKSANAIYGITHPVLLSIALNRAVFYFDVMNKPDRACTLAMDVFREATSELDGVADSWQAREATAMLVCIRDNLRVWAQAAMDDVAQDEAREQRRAAYIEAAVLQDAEERAERVAQRAQKGIDEAVAKAAARRR